MQLANGSGRETAQPSSWQVLRAALPAPPLVDVPASVWRSACLAWRRREVDTDLAAEIRLLPEHDLAGRRHLRFLTDVVQLDLVVRRSADAMTVAVVVRPRGRRRIVLRHDGPDVTASSDRFGRALFVDVAPGPVSLLLRSGSSRAATPWTLL